MLPRLVAAYERGLLTEAERTALAREEPIEVGLISPERFGAVLRLLAKEHPHYVPAAAMIHRHYRELMTEEEGEAWFEVKPGSAAVPAEPSPEAKPVEKAG